MRAAVWRWGARLVEETRHLIVHLVEDARLEVDQQRAPVPRTRSLVSPGTPSRTAQARQACHGGGGARDILLVVRLVEEHVLPVTPVRGKVLQHAVLVDAVLHAELLPELHANLVAALAHLQRDNLTRLVRVRVRVRVRVAPAAAVARIGPVAAGGGAVVEGSP